MGWQEVSLEETKSLHNDKGG